MVLALALTSTGVAQNQPAVAGDGRIQASYYTPRGLSTEPVTVMVQLGGETVAEAQGKQPGKKLTDAQRNKIKSDLASKQDSIKPAIRSLGGTVLNDFQAAYNGISVQIALNKVADLRKLSNVIGVHAIQTHERSNATSVPYIGTPAVWNGASGFRGENIKIAIIDTGIDYMHGNFRAPGTVATPAEYAAANAADTLPANPAFFGPSAPRIKGGIDLVGDNYNASGTGAALIPQPDPNPLDCNGHGSHVAGSAGGSGVLFDGSTYGGPYDPATHTPATGKFRVGPGVAPKADLYAVRVFGCAGSTDVTVDAIEWAVDNGMDVINMSLGSSFGGANDPSAVASTNAAKAGVIVVASAGNNGPNQYITGSPGTADSIISVAANDSNTGFRGFSLTLSTGPTITAINANDANVASGTSYGIKVIRDNPDTLGVDESLGCNVSDYGTVPPNTMAVVVRGLCARVGKAIRGQQAGAAAVAMINTDAGLPPFEGPIFSHPDTGEQFTVTIPFIGVRGVLGPAATADPDLLVAADTGSAIVNNILLPNPNHTGFATFTSGGPRTGDSFLKPQITAPGVSIFSTGNGSGNLAGGNSGTSMAAPHVAGVAALVDQAHPGWKTEDLHAAIANTGSPSAIGGTAPFRISRGGTGLVQPVAATRTQVVAFGQKDQFALNFGFAERKDKLDTSESINIKNNGSSAATFNVTTTAQGPPNGSPHTVTLGSSTVRVPGRGTANVAVKLEVPMSTIGTATGLNFREVAGLITLTPTGGSNNGVTLRVPYYFVPRALSLVETKVADSQPDGPAFTTTATVENKSDAARAGIADFYAWGLEDGNDLGKSAADVRAVGVQAFPEDEVTVFAVSSWNRWSNGSTAEFDIFVDVDRDGVDDYVVVHADQGAVQTGVFNGRQLAWVFSTRSAGATAFFFAGAHTDSSTSTLAVVNSQLCRAGEPCLNAANPRFNYRAVAFDLLTDEVDAVTGTSSFNAYSPSISNGAFITVAPGQTATTPITVNPTEWARTPAKGIMVVVQDNESGKSEADLLEVKIN
jgi:minor extracellular serine protease Vpr